MIIGFLIIYGCTKTIDFSIPDSNSQIVINGLLYKDSVAILNISKSSHVLRSDNIEYINNSIVKLFENDIYIENLINIGKGFYKGKYIIKADYRYKIIVETKGFKNIEAETFVPSNTAVTIVDFKSSNRLFPILEYQFIDNKDLNNYYLVNFWGTTKEIIYINDEYNSYNEVYEFKKLIVRNSDTKIGSNSISLSEQITEFFTGESDDNRGDFFYFSDNYFNGNIYKTSVEIINDLAYQENDYLYINFYSISEELYKYYQSINLFESSSESIFSTPVKIYSNVKNGIGVFASGNIVKDSILVINK